MFFLPFFRLTSNFFPLHGSSGLFFLVFRRGKVLRILPRCSRGPPFPPLLFSDYVSFFSFDASSGFRIFPLLFRFDPFPFFYLSFAAAVPMVLVLFFPCFARLYFSFPSELWSLCIVALRPCCGRFEFSFFCPVDSPFPPFGRLWQYGSLLFRLAPTFVGSFFSDGVLSLQFMGSGRGLPPVPPICGTFWPSSSWTCRPLLFSPAATPSAPARTRPSPPRELTR